MVLCLQETKTAQIINLTFFSHLYFFDSYVNLLVEVKNVRLSYAKVVVLPTPCESNNLDKNLLL